MTNLAQALVGWVTVMGMVFGGVGILFFMMSLLRSLAMLIRKPESEALQNATRTEPIGIPER